MPVNLEQTKPNPPQYPPAVEPDPFVATNENPDDPQPERKPPLSPQMTADEYADRVKDDRIAQLDAAEAAMKQRHEAENDAVAKRHEFEAASLARQREALDNELKAIHAYAELWHRQTEELAVCPPSERDHMHNRHNQERAELAKETGYDIRPPLVGESIIPGFPVPPRGHPWVRPFVPVH